MRIRTIKPEFFSHEELCDLPPLARLAFVGLLCAADREGRFEWRTKRLKLQILPWEKCDFEAILNRLDQCGFIQKYEHGGRVYGCIPTFLTHQRVNIREAKSTIPEPPEQCNAYASTCVHVQDEGEGEGKGNRKGNREMEGAYNNTPPVGGGFLPQNDQNLKMKKTNAAPPEFTALSLAYRPKSAPVFNDKLKRLWRDANPTAEEAALVAEYVTAWRTAKSTTDENLKYCCRELSTCLSKFGAQTAKARAWRSAASNDPNSETYYENEDETGWTKY